MLRAIIIDDEPNGINTLKVLIETHTKGIKIISVTTEPEKGIEMIEDYKPDVVFLDINMPRIDGFKLLESLAFKKFKLVFTTAYQEFALKAIKNRAFDYLVKPIDIEELKLCVNNVLESFGNKPANSKPNYENIIELSVKNGIIFIKPREIIRLEADRSYTVFHLVNNVRHIASKSLKEYEALLDPTTFFRSHPSHLINLHMVVRTISNEGLFVQMNDGSMPELLKRHKQGFLEKLKNI
jgi:two-component system LytT family response regulator